MIHHSRPTIGRKEAAAVRRVLATGHVAGGAESQLFGAELAARFGRRHAAPTASGLAALHLALLALGARPGVRVFIPSYVCSALLNAVHHAGAVAVLVDTPHEGFLADPSLSFLGPGDLAIYPQLFGVCAPLDAERAGRAVIEDCAMAMGPAAMRQGRLAIASFFATKMIATGQGGAVLTDDDALAAEIADLMAYDNRPTYRVRYNYDLGDLAAALGRCQLARLAAFRRRRAACAALYDALIAEAHPELLAFPGGLAARWPGSTLFRYWVRVADPDACARALAARGIEAKRPVFMPLHRYLGLDDALFPHATASWSHFLSLPLHPSLGDDDLRTVVAALCETARPAP